MTQLASRLAQSDTLIRKIENLTIILEEAILVMLTLPCTSASPRRHHDLLLISVLHDSFHCRGWQRTVVVWTNGIFAER
jgi:hypothetical protein